MSDQQRNLPLNRKNDEGLSSESQTTEMIQSAGFPIVGIGASAGGLAAFQAFFSALPADQDLNMAFVLVQHLAPDHESLLVEILSRGTRMPVFEAEDGMSIKMNCVYIIPPGYDMALMNGTLQLLEPSALRGHRLPIDFFFRSLALDQHQRSIGIILSGTASDGAQGVKAIKSEAGMVIAQTPESAEFDSMPRSAIATGLVDYQLAPADMPAQLLAYVSMAFRTLPWQSEAGLDAHPADVSMKKIFAALWTTTGHDFSHYKPSTIQRRIERRMAVQQIGLIDNYVKYLHQNPPEVEALFHDLLIGVTNFFRDPAEFLALEQQVIPKIFVGKFVRRGVVRVWICGCSTGEEAYSIAILLREYQEATDTQFAVQVFATDIDSRAIATARAGVYPMSVAADITPDRLSKYFQLEPNEGGYRIRKDIREIMVFSEHDINKDPPFSKLDLISCRNLLIYFDANLQKRLIPLFHFALNPEAYLFLGTSESIGDSNSLFTTLDRRSKLFQRKPGLPSLQNSVLRRFTSNITASGSTLARVAGKANAPMIPPLRALVERTLLQQWAPAAALVNASGDIFYLHGRTGMFLELSSGEAGVNNILKMAREGLRHELSLALHNVVATRKMVRMLGLAVKTNGHFTRANLAIGPVSAVHPAASDSPEVHFYLVIMEVALEASTAAAPTVEKTTDSSANTIDFTSDAETVIATLRAELRIRDEYLQSAREELESSNEELKSSNEEMQSVNEELQSTNEELETSREEMQSINEELATVNAELQSKVSTLTHLNDDMNNLLAGTGIATVFVDRNLCILRFTPAVALLMNLIPTDVGRPVGHIVSNLVNYNSLPADAQAVLATLELKESQVQTANGAWFMMRIRPYRTQDNVIEGVVITFVDITETKRIELALAKANEQLRLAVVVRDSHDAITVQDLDGRIIAWNPGATRIYGWSEAEALQMNVRDRIPEPLRKDCLSRVYQLSRAERFAPYDTQRITKDGVMVDVCMTVTSLVNEFGQMYAIATTERLAKRVAEVGE